MFCSDKNRINVTLKEKRDKDELRALSSSMEELLVICHYIQHFYNTYHHRLSFITRQISMSAK